MLLVRLARAKWFRDALEGVTAVTDVLTNQGYRVETRSAGGCYVQSLHCRDRDLRDC